MSSTSIPLFTPSTRAEQGAHDENISPEQGDVPPHPPQLTTRNPQYSEKQRRRSSAENSTVRPSFPRRFEIVHSRSGGPATRGLIIADTKFEFGLVDHGNELILIDEALTPDSSRYRPLEGYAPGRGQPSFDKQYLRDWLTSQGFRKGLEDGPDGQG